MIDEYWSACLLIQTQRLFAFNFVSSKIQNTQIVWIYRFINIQDNELVLIGPKAISNGYKREVVEKKKTAMNSIYTNSRLVVGLKHSIHFSGCYYFFQTHVNISKKNHTKMVKFADDKRPGANSQTADPAQLNFAHSFKSIYYLSRIFGFKPFTIVFDSNGKIQTAQIRAIDILWFAITIALYLLSALYFVIFASHDTLPAKSAFLVECTRSIYMLRKLLNILSIFMDMYNRFKLVGIVREIDTFDEKASIISHFPFQITLNYSIVEWLNIDGSRRSYFQLWKRATRFADFLCCYVDDSIHSYATADRYQKPNERFSWCIWHVWDLFFPYHSIWFKPPIFHVVFTYTAQNFQ